jgi:hypothetical protein
VDNHLLEGYTQALWFLEGIPKALREKIVRKHGVELNVASTMNFKAFSLTAIKYYESDQANKEMTNHQDYSLACSILVDGLQAQTTTVKDLTTLIPIRTEPDQHPSSVSVQPASPETPASDIVELTKAMQALVLSLSGVQGSLNSNVSSSSVRPLAGPDNQNQGRPGHCYLCFSSSHWAVQCPEAPALCTAGIMHFNQQNQICAGPVGSGEKMFQFAPGNTRILQLKQFSQRTNSNSPSTPETKVSSLSLAAEEPDPGAESDEEVRNFSWVEDEDGWVAVGASRAEKKKDDKPYGGLKDGRDQHRVLKNRQEKETGIAVARHLRSGKWKPVTSVDETEEMNQQDVPMPDQPQPTFVRSTSPKDFTIKPAALPAALARLPPNTRPRIRRLVDELRGEAKPEQVLNKILDQKVEGITTRELLSNSPALLKLVFQSPRYDPSEPAPSVTVDSHDLEGSEENPYYAVSTPKLSVRLNGTAQVKAMIDTGAEINVMTQGLADDCGLAVTGNPHLTLVSHNGERRSFEGLCENVQVEIGSVTSYAQIFLVKEADHQLILGQPFILQTNLTIEHAQSGAAYATVFSAGRNRSSVSRVMKASDSRNRVREDIFPLND